MQAVDKKCKISIIQKVTTENSRKRKLDQIEGILVKRPKLRSQ